MNLLIKYAICLTMVILLSMSCNISKEKNPTGTISLENTSWELIKFSDHHLKGTIITIHFESRKLHGTAVCNNYFSLFSLSENKISIAPVGATKKMCANNSKLEIDYFDFFSNTSAYEIIGNKLIFTNDWGTLEYERIVR